MRNLLILKTYHCDGEEFLREYHEHGIFPRFCMDDHTGSLRYSRQYVNSLSAPILYDRTRKFILIDILYADASITNLLRQGVSTMETLNLKFLHNYPPGTHELIIGNDEGNLVSVGMLDDMKVIIPIKGYTKAEMMAFIGKENT